MKKVIVFDINETVLDLTALQPLFSDAFGASHYTATWFSMLLHNSTVAMISGVHTDFATLSKITLDTLAARLNIPLSDAQRATILNGFRTLPPHKDIKPSLQRLRDAGFSTVALSNSSITLVTQQITNAELKPYFDELISVEEAATFKPNSAAYLFAAKRLSRPPEQLLLVATHDWDTHGAMSAGLDAAYIQRGNNLYNPLFKQPKIYAHSMTEIAEQIIQGFA